VSAKSAGGGWPGYNRNFLERSSSIKRVNFRLIHKSK
jgi:hypothetical protein